MQKNQPQDTGTVRADRRRRHAHDPTMSITVNIPVALLRTLDDVVVARNGTRSGLMGTAIRAWLDRQEDATTP